LPPPLAKRRREVCSAAREVDGAMGVPCGAGREVAGAAREVSRAPWPRLHAGRLALHRKPPAVAAPKRLPVWPGTGAHRKPPGFSDVREVWGAPCRWSRELGGLRCTAAARGTLQHASGLVRLPPSGRPRAATPMGPRPPSPSTALARHPPLAAAQGPGMLPRRRARRMHRAGVCQSPKPGPVPHLAPVVAGRAEPGLPRCRSGPH